MVPFADMALAGTGSRGVPSTVIPRRVEAWRRAANGTFPESDELLAGNEATVDWPTSAIGGTPAEPSRTFPMQP